MSKLVFGNKRGIGITEILIASLVLGFLLTALLQLQESNRLALLRIRSRDGAVDVARDVMDSLSAIGISSLRGVGDDNEIKLQRSRSWEGQPGLVPYTIKVDYDVTVKVSGDDLFHSTESSKFETIDNVFAKKIDVNVAWQFKGTTQSINVSGVLR
ncbi:MAG: type II secretion system protein [Fibrobacter sp.]|nr:type II secretion system protein [Fibrobacter sp.]